MRARLLTLLLKIGDRLEDDSAPTKPSFRSLGVQCSLTVAEEGARAVNGSREVEKRKAESVRNDVSSQTDVEEVDGSRKSSISSVDTDNCDRGGGDSTPAGWF